MVSFTSKTFLTSRLLLRRWRESDKEPFAALNADPRVMVFFPGSLTRPESDRVADRIERRFEERGFGLWALEERSTGRFVVFTGLSMPAFEANFTPCVEIGWRLAFEFWGRGYAFEAAHRALAFGFETLNLPEIVSMAARGNLRSRRLMERLGLRRDPAEDFDHPNVSDGALRRHVLYRLRVADWRPEAVSINEGAAA